MCFYQKNAAGIFVLSILLSVSAVCRAEFVPVERASVVASNFFHSNDATPNSVNRRMELYQCDESVSTKSHEDYPSYYIFQGENGKGFVIVAADDACQPVVGYSFDSSLPAHALPENFRCWLDDIDRQVRYIRNNKTESSEQIRSQWQYIKAAGRSKELNTAKWNQGDPFNAQCPMDNGENSLTGCVATATAIVMRYHKWPKYGKGKTESYYTATKNIYVPSRELNHSYNWDKMPTSPDASYPNDVARLMADIGAAYKADYTNSSTGAWLDIGVLYRNFGYALSVRNAYRNDYSDSEWISMLRRELDENRPVLYHGQPLGDGDGHCFVIDGYDSGNLFRINWGWGGYCDGYFTLNRLTPADGDYSQDQTAVLGVRPPVNEYDRITDWLCASGEISNGPVRYFQQNTPYSIGVQLYNAYSITFKGKILFAVTDRKGNIKEKLAELSETVYGEWRDYISRTVTVRSPINVGDRIRAFYKGDEEDEWRLLNLQYSGLPWEILIAQEYYLHEITGFEYDRRQNEIRLTTKEDADIKLFDPDGNDVSDNMSIYYSASDTEAVIDAECLMKGKYRITVSTESESLEMLFSIVY